MSVVSNSSPLINLARMGRLDLLSQLYGELVVPQAVWHEVVVQGTGQAGAQKIETATRVRVQPVTNRELVRALRQELDAGEAEAIALALAIDAKKKGVIDQIRPLLDTLRDLAGFWVGEGLCKRVLDDEGELV